MGFEFIKRNTLLRKAFVKYNNPKNRVNVFDNLKKHFKKSDKILNLGCGTCLFDEHAILQGHNVTSIDIYESSLSDLVKPIVYDGKKIPAKNKEYNVTLLLSILHHVDHQDELIKEVKRVSKKIIIQEDMVPTKMRKVLFSLFDNLINLDFCVKTNNYHSLEEWKQIFKKNGLKLKSMTLKKSYFFVKQATFVLE